MNNPLGVRGTDLHEWMFQTKMFQKMSGGNEGAAGIDNDFAEKSAENTGAWIMGRNMFGPIRGPWPDESWQGWWGDTPPYHTDVFVLTHHPRASVEMEGGTVFHFMTDGIEAALRQAKEAVKDKDIRIDGGVLTDNFIRLSERVYYEPPFKSISFTGEY